jgi:leader peptidase (prepilin peptidase)/N-methyltransferase
MEFLIFIFGIIIGSFLNVVIYRVPLNKSIISPKSSCPKCKQNIKFYHNVPILSYIFLKGKCAYCGEKISIRYPIIELITGILAILILKKTGLNYLFLTNFSLFSILLTLSVIDIDYHAVPDSLNLLALTISFFTNENFFQNLSNAMLLMGTMSAIRFYMSYFLKKEAMGEGDIIIAGVMGAVLGIKLSLFALFLASAIAIPPALYYKHKKEKEEIPFIPFLAIATFIVWYFKDFFILLEIKWIGI